MIKNELVEQPKIKRLLHQQMDMGKIAHAQLFLGKNGFGTLGYAIYFAKLLLCEPQDGMCKPCGNCRNCTMINEVAHPDLYFVYPLVSSTKVSKDRSKMISKDFAQYWREQLHENLYFDIADWSSKIGSDTSVPNINACECDAIIDFFSTPPLIAHRKVIIIWHSEYLGKIGNKLLKAIEEPFENNIIILLAENEEMVLPTILSRTQTIMFPRLTYSALLRGGVDVDKDSPSIDMAQGDIILLKRLLNHDYEHFDQLFELWYQAVVKYHHTLMHDFSEQFTTLSKNQQIILLQYFVKLIRLRAMKNIKKAGSSPDYFDKLEKSIEILEANLSLLRQNINNKIMIFANMIKIAKILHNKI